MYFDGSNNRDPNTGKYQSCDYQNQVKYVLSIYELDSGDGIYVQIEDNEEMQEDVRRSSAAERERKRSEPNLPKEKFDEDRFANKNVGDRVCSADNKFGYVDEVNAEKIKVLLKGRASRQKPYYFFDVFKIGSRFYIETMETTIWDDFSSWAACSFSEN